MSAVLASAALRDKRLRALGVAHLRVRRGEVARDGAGHAVATSVPPEVAAMPVESAPVAARIRRLALLADSAERRDPAVDKMYTALTEAVSKAGLQPVRVCDVAGDASAAVMVFGAAVLPEGIPLVRVLRADPLAVLHAERDRKRQLWEQLQALGRAGAG